MSTRARPIQKFASAVGKCSKEACIWLKPIPPSLFTSRHQHHHHHRQAQSLYRYQPGLTNRARSKLPLHNHNHPLQPSFFSSFFFPFFPFSDPPHSLSLEHRVRKLYRTRLQQRPQAQVCRRVCSVQEVLPGQRLLFQFHLNRLSPLSYPPSFSCRGTSVS